MSRDGQEVYDARCGPSAPSLAFPQYLFYFRPPPPRPPLLSPFLFAPCSSLSPFPVSSPLFPSFFPPVAFFPSERRGKHGEEEGWEDGDLLSEDAAPMRRRRRRGRRRRARNEHTEAMKRQTEETVEKEDERERNDNKRRGRSRMMQVYPRSHLGAGGSRSQRQRGPTSMHIAVFIPCPVAAPGPALEPVRVRSARVVLFQ